MSALPAWISATPHGVTLHLFIQPRASRTEVMGPHGDPPRLKIRVAAPPIEGRANEEVIAFLSKTLKIPASSLAVLRGSSSKFKDVACHGVTAATIAEKLIAHPG